MNALCYEGIPLTTVHRNPDRTLARCPQPKERKERARDPPSGRRTAAFRSQTSRRKKTFQVDELHRNRSPNQAETQEMDHYLHSFKLSRCLLHNLSEDFLFLLQTAFSSLRGKSSRFLVSSQRAKKCTFVSLILHFSRLIGLKNEFSSKCHYVTNE